VKTDYRGGAQYRSIYNIYRGMYTRCYVDKPWSSEYYCYGAKGIGICKEWLDSAMAFVAWALDSGYRLDHHRSIYLDRKDNDKDYSPENCHWVSSRESARNRSGVKLTVESVVEIKKRLATKESYASIGSSMGVSGGMVALIARGKNWTDVSV